MSGPFTVLMASDGTAAARAAMSFGLQFPWPAGTRLTGVVADAPGAAIGTGALLRGLLEKEYADEARRLASELQRHTADARVQLRRLPAVQAVLREQKAQGADVVVVGSRGAGLFGRLPLGSVSRRVVHEAPCPVLVVKGQARQARRFVIALDDSPAARRAAALVAAFTPPGRGRVLVVSVVPPVAAPSMLTAPSAIRTEVRRYLAQAGRAQLAEARRRLDGAARVLRDAGWETTTTIRRGRPLVEVLNTATRWRADVIVCGARRASGLTLLLLGSVADGLLAESALPVLVVK